MKTPLQSILRERFPDIFFFIDREECALGYSPAFREFYLSARPGYGAVQVLSYCPFTGAALPPTLRDRFFDELEALGFCNGLADIEKAPPEFQSEAWWIARGV